MALDLLQRYRTSYLAQADLALEVRWMLIARYADEVRSGKSWRNAADFADAVTVAATASFTLHPLAPEVGLQDWVDHRMREHGVTPALERLRQLALLPS